MDVVYTMNRLANALFWVVILVIMDKVYTNNTRNPGSECVVILVIMDMAYTLKFISCYKSLACRCFSNEKTHN